MQTLLYTHQVQLAAQLLSINARARVRNNKPCLHRAGCWCPLLLTTVAQLGMHVDQ